MPERTTLRVVSVGNAGRERHVAQAAQLGKRVRLCGEEAHDAPDDHVGEGRLRLSQVFRQHRLRFLVGEHGKMNDERAVGLVGVKRHRKHDHSQRADLRSQKGHHFKNVALQLLTLPLQRMRQPYRIKQDVEALLPLHPVKVLRGALLQIQKQLSRRLVGARRV